MEIIMKIDYSQIAFTAISLHGALNWHQLVNRHCLHKWVKVLRVPTFPQPQNSRIFPGFFKEFDAIFQVYFCIGS